jgi:hypothetical protein
MTNAELIAFFEKTAKEVIALRKAKAVDYSHNDDAFLTIRMVAEDTGLKPEQVLHIFMTKHYDAIRKYLIHPGKTTEPIEARINDLIVYLILIKALLSERRPAKTTLSPAPAPIRLGGHRDVDRPRRS